MMAKLKAYKLALQAMALLLMVLAALPIYFGLQSGTDALVWFGLLLVAVGMSLSLWIG